MSAPQCLSEDTAGSHLKYGAPPEEVHRASWHNLTNCCQESLLALHNQWGMPQTTSNVPDCTWSSAWQTMASSVAWKDQNKGLFCRYSLNSMSRSNMHTLDYECCCFHTGLSASAAKTVYKWTKPLPVNLPHSSSKRLGPCRPHDAARCEGLEWYSSIMELRITLRGELSVVPCCRTSTLAFSSLSCCSLILSAAFSFLQ